MSKVFEALCRGDGELPDAILPCLAGGPSPAGQAAKPDAPPETVPPLDPAAISSVIENAVSSRLEPFEVPTDPFGNGIRTRPVRLVGKSPLLPFDEADSVAAEQYRIIRTRLIQHPSQPRFLLITSAGPGEGKSITAINVAGALSLKNDAKVLLMDTDFRRSSIHMHLGLPVSPGLADVLSGTATLDEVLVRIEQFPNLYFAPAGDAQVNPSELLDSARWTSLRDLLRTEFRYIVADSPPIASVADYDLLQASCDGIVVVARPDYTKREACLRALKLIPKQKLIGVVMNCVGDWFLARNYDYYGSYYQRKPRPAVARGPQTK